MRPLRLLPPALLAVLGAAQLGRGHGLWYDELYTVAVVRRPVAEIVPLVVQGNGPTGYVDVPPSFNGPYYVLARLWTQLPVVESDAPGLRSLSLVAAVTAVGVLVAAVARLHGERVALVAGLLAAASPLLLAQAVQARPYGLALLATTLALLGLARWLQGGGLVLFGLAGAAMGLLHWFAVPALAGLALGAALARRRWAPLLVAAAATAPTLGLVVLALSHDVSAGGYLSTTGLLVPPEALLAWGGGLPLGLATLAAGLVGVLRSGALERAWLLVPVVAVTAVDLVRPVFVPRYLLPGLLALAVLAAIGASGRRPLLVLLAAGCLVADATVLTAPRLERADQVVALLLEQQRAGEPVVAVEARSALGLAHYAAGTRLAADLRLPPQDPPAGSERVWLVRQQHADGLRPSDDDAVLAADGLRPVRTERFPAVKTDLVVQLWER